MEDLAGRLLREGYDALPRARRRHGGGDVFVSSLLGRRAVVVRGREGARLFYDPAVVQRSGALPPPLADLIFGRGAVHGTDGAEHAQRKQVFLDILTDERTAELATTIGRDLERRVATWSGREVVVFDELVEAYGAAVLAWAGIPTDAGQAPRVSRRLAAIVDGFGGQGVAYPRAWAARLWGNRWARRLVSDVRGGDLQPPAGSVLAELGTGCGADLPPGLAGIELLNVLRPTVAVAWPGTFLAREVAMRADWRQSLRADASRRVGFGHEVRRTCPFVPALAGRARREAEIDGTRVEPGDFLVLDVPGTDSDPAWWDAAEEFRPDRFDGVMPDPFAFVPQGGGDPGTGHRCPGESLTVGILAETARVLAGVDLELTSDPAHDPRRIPTLPARGLPVRVAPR